MKYVIAFLFLSISIAALIVANQLFVDVNDEDRLNPRKKIRGALNDEPRKLFWFLQISDIHVSKFKDPSRISDFRTFTSQVVDVIKPKVVIASGDLTDAKDKMFGSGQYVEEWRAYHNALQDNGIFNKTHWLDIRGNHDTFNVDHLAHVSDLYMKYSAQGLLHHNKKSYLHQEVDDGVKYNFLALDASNEPGTKRPYNFFGIVPRAEMNRINMMLYDSPGDFIIWFAHYPTSTILTPDIRRFIGHHEESSIYVAGHLHTLASLERRMYTLQPEGFLELELGDFMKNRLFRIGVFDNGIFSFKDVKLGQWPIVVVTNPKDLLFNNPFKEDIEDQIKSTHVRILAFSPAEIKICKIRLNDEMWVDCDKKTKNFFTIPWLSSKYIHGKHRIQVTVTDVVGRTAFHEQIFSLDGSRTPFNILARFILMNDFITIFQALFVLAFLLNLTVMVFFKVWQLLLKYRKLKRPMIAFNPLRRFIQRMLVFAGIDRLYFGVLLWLFYTLVGPWSFHEVLDGHIGIYFVWGIFIKGQFIAGTLNWWYGFYQLLFFQFPLMLIIAGVAHRRFNDFLKLNKSPPLVTNAPESPKLIMYKNVAFIILLLAEILLALLYINQNGILYAFIAPMRIWGVVLSVYLFHQANSKISDEDFNELSRHVLLENKLAIS